MRILSGLTFGCDSQNEPQLRAHRTQDPGFPAELKNVRLIATSLPGGPRKLCTSSR